MNADRLQERENKRMMKVFKRMFDIFGMGGHGKHVSETKSETYVFVDKAHVMACSIPSKTIGVALATFMPENCKTDFKYPAMFEYLKDVGAGQYPIAHLIDALIVLEDAEETSAFIRYRKGYPLEISGEITGFKFAIAPMVGSEEMLEDEKK